MTIENEAPTTPAATPPSQPAAPPAPDERRRLSTAFVRQSAEEPPATPPQPRADNGQFAKPAEPPVPTPAQQAPAVPAPSPPPPKHQPWMVEMATDLGFEPADIEAMDSASLGVAMRYAQRAPRQQPNQAPPPEPEPEVDLGLTPEQLEEFGPDMIGVLTRIAKQNAVKSRDLEKRLGQYEQREIARTRDQAFSTIDEAISSLPAEYTTILGAGQGHEVLKASPGAFRKRKMVLDSLAAEGLNFATAPMNVIRERIRARTEEDFAGLIKKPAPAANPPAITREEWNRGGSPPPTQRNGGSELPPREGGSIEDRHRGAVTEEEIADEKIRASLRRRKQPKA